MMRPSTAQDKKTHGKECIAVKECISGYNHPIYRENDPWLTAEEIKAIKSFEVK